MSNVATWPSQAESWLDERGKGAWIGATVLGFIVFWPAGVALLAYAIWSKRMFNKSCAHRGNLQHSQMHRHWGQRHGFRSSGNMAFDAYKSETLQRLEEEQNNFEAFLQRLRESKDKTEFDAFMKERARAAREVKDEDEDENDNRA